MWQIDTERTTHFLQEMVKIDSVNPGLVAGAKGEGAMAAWLEKTCCELGFTVELQETAPGRPNVIARWKGTGDGKSLLLTGHTDVVSGENMTRDPFEARIENGLLYGRGAQDMKGGLASILGAVTALKTGGFTPKGDIILGLVTDEEYLSIGTDALVKTVKADAAILTEPTGCEICIAHKGFAWLTLTTYGKAAHGSLYDDGVDAVAHMGHLLRELDTFNANAPYKHPLLERASAHASFISGGLGLSTYPDECNLQIEHRMLPDDTPESVISYWEKAIERLSSEVPNFSATVKQDFYRPGYEIDKNAAIVQTMDATSRSLMGSEPSYMGMFGWLDSAILGSAGIPTVILGPGGAGMHGAVEYVILDDVMSVAAVIAEAAAAWTG
jgi:acetylornithine deacetylase/succinyl-diaminopimelate desuccinylase family protein